MKVYSGIIMPEIQRMTRWCPIVSSLLHLPTICNHWQIYTNALSGTLRKWRKSGENPEPGVCQAQAGQPSLKKSGSITFHSLTCTWVLTSKDSAVVAAISTPLCVWCDALSSDDEKKGKKRNGHPEGVSSIAYQLNFEEASQTLVVTIIQCRSHLPANHPMGYK